MISHILDLLYPRVCEICGDEVDRPGRYVCSECMNRLPFVETVGCCRVCGGVAVGLDREFLCEDCRSHPPSFDRVACTMEFRGDARTMVNSFKFRCHYWLRNDLSDWLEAAVRTRFKVGEIDIVMPMPSTIWHRIDRGYNQCAWIARELARRLDKPFCSSAIRRKGMPKRQGGLSEVERRKNVVGTFAVRKPDMVCGKTVMIVDDIMTTGSTLSECAAELKRAGADRVWCAVLARSVHDR